MDMKYAVFPLIQQLWWIGYAHVVLLLGLLKSSALLHAVQEQPIHPILFFYLCAAGSS